MPPRVRLPTNPPPKKDKPNGNNGGVKRVRLDGTKGVNGTKSNGGVKGDSLKMSPETLAKYPNGNPKLGIPGPGRPPGPNNFTKQLKFAIMGAAEQVGEDGKGKGGTLGYMKRLATFEPAVFAGLLKRILPVQIKADLDPNGLASRMLQAAAAQKSLLNGNQPATIDITPRLAPPPKPAPGGDQNNNGNQ